MIGQKDLNFNVFVHQKWTPLLMNMTLANSLQEMNEFADEITYRISGDVQLTGARGSTFLPCRPAQTPWLRRP